jgi:hypothetical protein
MTIHFLDKGMNRIIIRKISFKSPHLPFAKGRRRGMVICSETLYGLRLAILCIYDPVVSVTSVANHVWIFALRLGWL